MDDFAWTDTVVLVDRRIEDIFIKRGRGDKKVSFTIPIKWIDQLDIFSNFRLQDPFGLSATGAGEYGRYYYVESLTYDFLNQTIHVVGVDMQYIVGQCMIVPNCADVEPAGAMSDDWAGASELDRMYAYVGNCATEAFSDGKPLKKVCSCY